MEKIFKAYYQSPIGIIEIGTSEEELLSIYFVDKKEENSDYTPMILKESYKQIDEYFKGIRKEFNLKIKLEGTDFQKKVWMELSKIPYGKVVSYKDIAVLINNEKAVRAVGSANGSNKISIVLPCHRVIGNNGKLTGYAWGLDKKEWLLKHEGIEI